MFCRNCGSPMDPNAAVCPGCGVRAGEGSRYCWNCGGELYPANGVCQRCGAPQRPNFVVGGQQKSRLVAGLLGIFLGGWGVHNFYLGYTRRGVIQIIVTVLTLGIGRLWGFIEGIMILSGETNTDADGNPLKE